MSQQELKRVETIALRRSGQISQTEAARRLGLTHRQVRRLETKVATQSAAGLRSARRGQPSNHRVATPTVAKVSTLIRAHYRDFGPTLASLTQLRFVPQKCTLGYVQALYGHVQQHGLPMTLYSDRHGIFGVNGGEARDDLLSEFGRALQTLGIESTCANSPQAKGRVERVNGVLQDRLLRAMRIEGINAIDQANAWLPVLHGTP